MTNDQITVSRELLRQVLGALQSHSHPRFLPDDFAEAITALRTALEQPAVGPELVSVFGVKPSGEVVDTGVKAQMPPRMKAKDLVNEMYGHTWEQDDGSEPDLCFAVCEQFFEWLIDQGWKAAPQAQEKS